MDLDELRSVRRTERQKDSLQHLRDSFYEDVAAYIAERKAERRRAAEAAADPFGDPEVGQLTDEIGTAEDVVEAIYERRVGKVVKLASFAAADMSADKTGLTAEERDLFDDLVERIKQNRRSILDMLAGEGRANGAEAATPTPADADVEAPTDGPPTSEGVNAADADATPTDLAATEPDAADPAGGGTDRPTPGTGGPADPPVSDDPPAPDDVLAAAMGGNSPPSAAGAGSGTDTDPEAGVRTDAEGDPVPPEGGSDPATSAGRERDRPAPDEAETDGGAATAGPPPAGSPSTQGAADVGSRGTGDVDGSTDGGPADRDDRVTLRITADVGRIYGVDEREYDLESEDVVRLPATNAGPLVDRGAAERLE